MYPAGMFRRVCFTRILSVHTSGDSQTPELIMDTATKESKWLQKYMQSDKTKVRKKHITGSTDGIRWMCKR